MALCFLFLSMVLLAICLWREREQCGSYFRQAAKWTPPLLVISSDDWGGVDPPETIDDLDHLGDALESVRDARGRSLVLTAYMNPAEPDFEQIVDGQYAAYHYRYCYQDAPQIAAKLRELYEKGVVDIGFHGREHYNIPLWLSLLQEDRPGFREACQKRHVPWREGPGWDVEADPRLPFLRQSFLDASSYPPKSLPIDVQREMITSGLALMETELDVVPAVFTPPGYAHDLNTLRAMNSVGLVYVDSIGRPVREVNSDGEFLDDATCWDYDVEIAGIRAVVRNVHFEPYRTSMSAQKYLRATMKVVRRQLRTGRPVVISSHRWNYVKAVNPNCERDTLLLRDLVQQIRREAPEVIFLGASDLARCLYEDNTHAARDVAVKRRNLSGRERVVHGLRCVWLGHARIRMASLFLLASLAWLCSLCVTGRQPPRPMNPHELAGERHGSGERR